MEREWCGPSPGRGLHRRLASLLCEESESKYLGPCRLHGFLSQLLNSVAVAKKQPQPWGRLASLQHQAEGQIVWGSLGLWLGVEGGKIYGHWLPSKKDKGAERTRWGLVHGLLGR